MRPGAFLASCAYITIRVIGERAPSLTIAFWFHLVALITSAVPLVLGIPQPAVWPEVRAWLALLSIGACSFVAQLLLNRGFQLQRAALASALSFSQVVWGALLGAVFYHEHITLPSAIGAFLIATGVLAVASDKKPATEQCVDAVPEAECSVAVQTEGSCLPGGAPLVQLEPRRAASTDAVI